jgi:N-acetylglucosaminyldiphosphoundecaprenol N-acetyl-beta-D-mannosaminyltransferase
MRKVNFFGTLICEINSDEQIKEVFRLADGEIPGYITYSNVHVLVSAKKDPVLRNAINNAAIASPDGMPLVWVSRLKGYKKIAKCSGPDMMEKIITESLDKGYKHFFFGSTEDTLDKLSKALRERYPNIQIVGMISPPFRPLSEEEQKAVMEQINASGADFIWVGLGAPKQEIWMSQYCPMLKHGVMLGVGAAFDFQARSKKRAPLWMQKTGLEWLFRLLSEPGRLWKRYLVTNSLFVFYLFLQLFSRKTAGERKQAV